jgi:hypothetical protein
MKDHTDDFANDPGQDQDDKREDNPQNAASPTIHSAILT